MNIQIPRFINQVFDHILGIIVGIFLLAVVYATCVFWFTDTSPMVVRDFLAAPFENTEVPDRHYPDNPEPVIFSEVLDINQSTAAENLTPQQRMRRMVRSVVRIRVSLGGNRGFSGSGVILDNRKCLVVTNEHVIDAAGPITVQLVRAVLDNGEEVIESVSAVVVGRPSEEEDLAILQLSSCGHMPWAYWLDEQKPLRGSTAIAIGSPRGQYWTSTVGTISHPARFWPDRIPSGFGLIQTDAAINPGNSGGGLFDENGRLLGINSMILRKSNNLGYARSTAALINYLRHLRHNGELASRALSVTFEDHNEFGTPYFILLTEAPTDLDYVEGDLRKFDAIIGANGEQLLTLNSLHRLIWKDLDGVVDLTIIRDDEVLTVKVRVTDQEDVPESASPTPTT